MFGFFTREDKVPDHLIVDGELISRDEYKDKLRNQGLDDEEIRLVMDEGYDPSNFEEDFDGTYEDDDYYNEDF